MMQQRIHASQMTIAITYISYWTPSANGWSQLTLCFQNKTPTRATNIPLNDATTQTKKNTSGTIHEIDKHTSTHAMYERKKETTMYAAKIQPDTPRTSAVPWTPPPPPPYSSTTTTTTTTSTHANQEYTHKHDTKIPGVRLVQMSLRGKTIERLNKGTVAFIAAAELTANKPSPYVWMFVENKLNPQRVPYRLHGKEHCLSVPALDTTDFSRLAHSIARRCLQSVNLTVCSNVMPWVLLTHCIGKEMYHEKNYCSPEDLVVCFCIDGSGTFHVLSPDGTQNHCQMSAGACIVYNRNRKCGWTSEYGSVLTLLTVRWARPGYLDPPVRQHCHYIMTSV